MDRRSRRRIGAVAWGVGLAVALAWGALDSGGAEGVGYGFAPPVEVAALETARVSEVPVALHEVVSADQVVARLDPAPLVAERELASANLLAVEEDQSRMAVTEARRFAEGVEGTLVDRARIGAQLSEDQAALDALRERAAVEESLLASGASSSEAVEEWHRQIHVAEARVQADRRALDAASSAAEGARDRQGALGALPTGNQWAVLVATRELERIEGRIARLDLKAGIDGQVSWVYKRPGDVVPAGTPVLQVKPRSTREVVAFLSPSEVAGCVAGDPASVRRSSGQVVHGELVSVGAGPQPMPAQLWRMPGWPQYGVPVRVRLEAEIGPDEAVTVRL